MFERSRKFFFSKCFIEGKTNNTVFTTGLKGLVTSKQVERNII